MPAPDPITLERLARKVDLIIDALFLLAVTLDEDEMFDPVLREIQDA